MAAGYEPGGPVLRSELIERPHGVDHQRRMRLGHWVNGVVPVQDLGLLARPDADADRCAELVVAQYLVEDAEQQRAGGDRIEHACLGEERVDPLCAESLERVPPGPGGTQPPV